jgi:hypothetical protein
MYLAQDTKLDRKVVLKVLPARGLGKRIPFPEGATLKL